MLFLSRNREKMPLRLIILPCFSYPIFGEINKRILPKFCARFLQKPRTKAGKLNIIQKFLTIKSIKINDKFDKL